MNKSIVYAVCCKTLTSFMVRRKMRLVDIVRLVERLPPTHPFCAQQTCTTNFHVVSRHPSHLTGLWRQQQQPPHCILHSISSVHTYHHVEHLYYRDLLTLKNHIPRHAQVGIHPDDWELLLSTTTSRTLLSLWPH